MFKKLAVIFTVLTIVSMLLVPIAFAADNDVVSISITQNKSFYIGEDADNVTLTVIGTREDGTTVDVSDKISWPFTLDGDKSVFYFNGYKLCSTGKTGKAIIRVPYKNAAGTTLTADMVVVRQNATTDAGQPIAADRYVEGRTNTAYITTGDPGTPEGGHFDGSAFSNWTNNYQLRLQKCSYGGENAGINYRWFDGGYRSMAAWFYDDGVEDHKQGFSYVLFSDSIEYHKNFVDDYGYTPELAEKWKGMNSWRAYQAYALYSNQYGNYCDGTKFGNTDWGFGKRSKGWHQFVSSLEKNPKAEYGWSVYNYLDGVFIGKNDIVPQAAPITTDTTAIATMEIRPVAESGYKNYLDDVVVMGSLEKVDTSKTLTGAIGENGSVTVNGESFGNGATVKLEENADINIKAMPNVGYEVDEVKLDETAITLNASGEATAKMPAADATLTVTFKAKTVVAPAITTNSANNYFKTVDGKPTAFVYAKLSDYYDPSFNAGYGMKVWVDGDPANALILPAMENSSAEAVAAPNTAFAIRVYGNAITSDKSYVFKPYVGTTEGDEVKVTFAE